MHIGIVSLLGVLGAAIGSFLNVLALRYNPDLSFFDRSLWGGRSYCPHCKKTLTVLELIPLVSWVWQGGRCRNCKEAISGQYFLVELATGVLFIGLALCLDSSFIYGFDPFLYFLWALVFSILILIALIDYRTTIIPNELNGLLFVVGLIIAFYSQAGIDPALRSFVGPQAMLFGWQDIFLLNRVIGILVPAVFFLILILITKGKGMGGGDMKLGAALGAVFGWPDGLVIVLFSFVVGLVLIVPSLLKGKKRRKDLIPFGQFMVMSAFIIFFWGEVIVRGYFSLFPIAV